MEEGKGKEDTPQANVLLVDSAPTSTEASPSASQEDLHAQTNHHLMATFNHLAVHPSFLPDDCGPPPSEPPVSDATPPPYSTLSLRNKWAVVSLITLAGMFSALSSNIFFPAIPNIANSLGVTSQNITLTVTYYMIFQGITPAFWGCITDVVGRRPVYIATFVVYIAASLGLANTNKYVVLVVLRCLQATGAASVIAIGAGSIGDVSSPQERGGYMAIFSLGSMLGPCYGPVVGGLLAARWGWQSIFWFLSVFSIFVWIVIILVLPETLRSLVGNGSIPATGVNLSPLAWFKARRHASPPPLKDPSLPTIPKKTWRDIRPFAPYLLFAEKDVLLLLTFNSVVYTLFYTVVTSTASLFTNTYGLGVTAVGLCFLANGSGCLLASAVNGPRMNRDFRIVKEDFEAKAKAKLEEGKVEGEEEKAQGPRDAHDLSDFPIERARLRSLPVGFFVLVISTISFGWTVEKAVHISAPLVLQFIIGFTCTMQFNSVATLVVDLFPGQSASATAASNLYRCLMGAAGTAAIEPLIGALGPGRTFSLLGGLTMCFVPIIVVEWNYGMVFRRQRAERRARREAAAAGGV